MSAIQFERYKSTLRILNPFNDFAEEEHRVEVRKDPLLGDTSVYNPYLKDKAKAFFGENDAGLIERLVAETAKTCIFCGDSVRKKTARYPDDLVSGGRIEVGEAVLFANLFSIAAYHPVIVLSKEHFLMLSDFKPRMLSDGFRAAKLFLRDIYQRDVTASFATVNANYLMPAGASIVHPHMQMLVGEVPYSYHARLLKASGSYLVEHGTEYHADLIIDEKKAGERYIAQQGGWHWIAAFSPTGSNEITGIHESESDLEKLTERDLRDLCDGISKVLALFESFGYLSFNYSLYSAKGGDTVGFHCMIKIVNRQNLYPNYRNDDYFLQKLLQSDLILNLPEDLAVEARKFFVAGEGTKTDSGTA
jgi:UDPglucose--hexose-1-phosphate uridylyltransferase